MLGGGESVLVAVSGGADSVALLHVLATLAPAWGLRLHALHVDHGLRADSARDAEFVRRLGERLGIPVDVATVTVERRGSLEAAARAARYAALAACADRVGAARIALGHTADDQAETALMRVLQGAGLRGLAGIPPVRDRIIRPLIECRRADLVAELRQAGLEWVEDPSNQDPKFLRNRIRHELLPWLIESVSPEIADGLVRVAAAAPGTRQGAAAHRARCTGARRAPAAGDRPRARDDAPRRRGIRDPRRSRPRRVRRRPAARRAGRASAAAGRPLHTLRQLRAKAEDLPDRRQGAPLGARPSADDRGGGRDRVGRRAPAGRGGAGHTAHAACPRADARLRWRSRAPPGRIMSLGR